jgi:hypothetical protein
MLDSGMNCSFRNPTFCFNEQEIIMKFKGFLCHVSFLWVDGMALFPFILVKRKSPGRVLLNHECIHLRQQLEMGLVFFYVWYFAEYLIRLMQHRVHYLAYMHISFEQEAYRNEADLDYLLKRRWWAFLKYV